MEPQDRDVLRVDLHSERGATAIIVASAMLVLLGFAAFAVDISAARNEQRLDQAAADAAALAGGVGFLAGDPMDQIVDDIQRYAEENLNSPEPLDWSTCRDPEALPEHLTSECISMGPDEGSVLPYRRLRVRIPTQDTETTFGRVLGVETIETFAVAEVTFEPTIDELELFPAALSGALSTGSRRCLSGVPSPSSPIDRCEGHHGVIVWLDLDACEGSPLDEVMWSGTDILFTVYRSGTPRTGCDPFPNAAASASPGPGDLNHGLVERRLATEPWPVYGDARIDDWRIDNRPLWSFIDEPGSSTACADAASGATTTDDSEDDDEYVEARNNLFACLGSPPDDLFSAELYESPRLVLLPVITSSHIDGFVPAFIDSIWVENPTGDPIDCDKGFESDGDSCRHDAGREGSTDEPARSASVIVLSCDVLAADGISGAEKCSRVPGPGGDDSTVFFEFALSG